MSVVGECFFWYRLTRVVPDNFHRAVKRLCVCVLFTVLAAVYVHLSEYVSYYLRCEVGKVENPFKDVSTVLTLNISF